jgi:hypothetical protein
MTTLTQAIDITRKRIADAAHDCGRDPTTIELIAVSKTVPDDVIRHAYEHGQRCFGESYLQEAIDKLQALKDCAIEWHFIGPIQSNKTRLIASHFDWVHSIDRLKIARRLSEQRPPECPPLNVCLQINISDEASKSGLALDELLPTAHAVAALPRLHLRGLMAIPAPSSDPQQQFKYFAAVATAQQHLIDQGLKLDTLSMGMSGDLEAAIKAGATHVRVGSAIFGERNKIGLRTE